MRAPFHPCSRATVTAIVLRRIVTPTLTKLEGPAIEDDCLSIKALRDVNSLAASIALKENLMVSVRVSLISTTKETTI
jgi:hypothetical protein